MDFNGKVKIRYFKISWVTKKNESFQKTCTRLPVLSVNLENWRNFASVDVDLSKLMSVEISA